MNECISAFFSFYRLPWKYIKQQLVCSLLTFLVQFGLYLAVSALLFEGFNLWFIDRIAYQLIGESIKLVPDEVFRFGTSLASPALIPLVLYLSWLFSINLSSIITGIFNTRLSLSCESSNANPSYPREAKTRFFEIAEDLVLLASNLLFSTLLFFLLYFFGFSSAIVSILFWLVSLLVPGLYNIGYALLPRRMSYLQMLGLVFSSKTIFARFIGFSFASGVIPFLLSWVVADLSWNHVTFIVLMLIFSLHRPFGIVSGTLLGNSLLQKGITKKPHLSGLYRVCRCLIIALGLFLFANLIYFSIQLDSKTQLFSCKFTISDQTVATLDPANLLPSLLAKPEQTILHLDIQVHNPTKRTIQIESLTISARLGSHELAKTSISGARLAPALTNNLTLKITVRPLSLLSSVTELILHGGNPLQIKAWITIQTLLFPLEWPVSLVSL